MDDADQVISGYGSRLKWQREQLSRHLAARTAAAAGVKNIVAWYLRNGAPLMRRSDLEQMLGDEPQLLELAKSLSDEEINAGRPPPRFDRGDAVEVIVNAKNIAYHKGHVRQMQWHNEERQWHYLLEDDSGRNVGKHYLHADLRAIAD